MPGFFETWITRLRVAWMGEKAQAIFGGFALVHGDRAREWAQQANVEHMPGKASAAALPLIGSERRLERGPAAYDPEYGERLTKAFAQWGLAGTPLGTLLQLYFAGFPGAVLVQQNGRYHQLTGAPDLDDPFAVYDFGPLGGNPDLNDHPWWTFDYDNDFCSRFAVLFPGGGPAFTHVGTATFDETDEAVCTWSWPFDDANYLVQRGAIYNASGGIVEVVADPATRTTAGVTLRASDAFTGTVDAIAWTAGDNPFASITAQGLARLRRVIREWKPKKATCMGIFVLVQGEFWGWPVGTWGDPGGVWGGTVVEFSASA